MKSTKTVIVLGGGFTGVAAAVGLARRSPIALEVEVVEPRAEVGRGVAYSARHRDHRLNAPMATHFIVPEEPEALERWFEANVGLERDPEARAFDDSIFLRRADFGAFMLHEFERHRAGNPSGTMLRHRRDAAVDVFRDGDGFAVVLAGGGQLRGDAVVVTTSNDRPTAPFPFANRLEAHPAFLADPWDVDAIEAVDAGARVLLVGAGLTAADVVAALVRQGHRGLITSLSRRGFRPSSRPRSHATLPQPIWERLGLTPSLFTARHGRLETVRAVLRAVRGDVARAAADGVPWQSAFDDLRDSAREVWLGLPVTEKRRYMRHLRPFYDVHRFRYPPQTEEQLLAAEARGILERCSGRLLEAADADGRLKVRWEDRASGAVRDEAFDAVVSCVGPETRPRESANPALHALLDRGLARASPLGIGLDVDVESRALGRDGLGVARLFVMGPLTFATFGYPLGAAFIVSQIAAALPHVFKDLGLSDCP